MAMRHSVYPNTDIYYCIVNLTVLIDRAKRVAHSDTLMSSTPTRPCRVPRLTLVIMVD